MLIQIFLFIFLFICTLISLWFFINSKKFEKNYKWRESISPSPSWNLKVSDELGPFDFLLPKRLFNIKFKISLGILTITFALLSFIVVILIFK